MTTSSGGFPCQVRPTAVRSLLSYEQWHRLIFISIKYRQQQQQRCGPNLIKTLTIFSFFIKPKQSFDSTAIDNFSIEKEKNWENIVFPIFFSFVFLNIFLSVFYYFSPSFSLFLFLFHCLPPFFLLVSFTLSLSVSMLLFLSLFPYLSFSFSIFTFLVNISLSLSFPLFSLIIFLSHSLSFCIIFSPSLFSCIGLQVPRNAIHALIGPLKNFFLMNPIVAEKHF